MLERILVSFLEGAALAHLDACRRGRWADAGLDGGGWSDGPRRGEEEADDLLYATGYWHDAQQEAFEDKHGL
jgi:hypothetical protein